MKKRFLVDVDEVLADYQGAFFDTLYDLYGRRLTADAYTTWDIESNLTLQESDGIRKAMAHPGWCSSIKPIPGALEAIQELRKFAEVIAVTSPPSTPT
jgi:5'(3')-deoxyribonucleotidase